MALRVVMISDVLRTGSSPSLLFSSKGGGPPGGGGGGGIGPGAIIDQCLGP